jgi:hypothetical protein
MSSTGAKSDLRESDRVRVTKELEEEFLIAPRHPIFSATPIRHIRWIQGLNLFSSGF